MRKRIISVILICLMFLTACSGYNKIMYDHLSEPENYKTFQVNVVDIYYRKTDSSAERHDYDNFDISKYEACFEVTFNSYEDVKGFLGSTPNKEKPLSDYVFHLHIVPENSKALWDSGFYKEIALGETIEVRASDFIYMDGQFFYIVDVKYLDKEYLNLDQGIKNMKDYMDEDRSLF